MFRLWAKVAQGKSLFKVAQQAAGERASDRSVRARSQPLGRFQARQCGLPSGMLTSRRAADADANEPPLPRARERVCLALTCADAQGSASARQWEMSAASPPPAPGFRPLTSREKPHSHFMGRDVGCRCRCCCLIGASRTSARRANEKTRNGRQKHEPTQIDRRRRRRARPLEAPRSLELPSRARPCRRSLEPLEASNGQRRPGERLEWGRAAWGRACEKASVAKFNLQRTPPGPAGRPEESVAGAARSVRIVGHEISAHLRPLCARARFQLLPPRKARS